MEAEDFCCGVRVGTSQYHVQTTSKAAVYKDLTWWRHPESDRLHLNCTKTENKLDELYVARYPGADCDTDHQLLVATLKVRLAKRQREQSTPTLNLKKEKAVQFAAEVTNRFTALEAAQDEVTPDLWKCTKTVLLEVARKKRLDVSSCKRKKMMRLLQQSGKAGSKRQR